MFYTLSSYTLDVCEMLVTGLVAEWRGGFVDLDFSKALATVSHPCLVAGGPAGGQLLMLCHRAQYWGGVLFISDLADGAEYILSSFTGNKRLRGVFDTATGCGRWLFPFIQSW